MLLEAAHKVLGWPQPKQVLEPAGSGARIYAEQAKKKIGEVLSRSHPGLSVETGVLAADANSPNTEAPIAVVCQFPRGASSEVLDEAHQLAWNFSRTALLITLEPHQLIAWSCCQTPKAGANRRVCRISNDAETLFDESVEQQNDVADLLRWVSLLTGQLLREYPEHFQRRGRADSCLLHNLREIRHQLLEDGMPERYCHDLLARIIFTQFLFQRKDNDGRAFFDEKLLAGRCDGALKGEHRNLVSILDSKNDTYNLFRWLDERFNGDLFPGKENQSDTDRDLAWQEEKNAVTDKHLSKLAHFVSGGLEMATGQTSLWPQYSFDTIPLEFISSVYEEFLNEVRFKDKAYYTPSYLVDFVLDGVLPWDGIEWDIKILDPSCGSGIFLVKAFQRLVYRWRNANPGRDPLVSDLKPMLAKNFMGIDKNPEAIRVACFSLCLAMADAIEPKYYLKREKVFPRLRGTRLIAQDFFDEATAGIHTVADGQSYHFVVGNAPWGDGSIKGSSEAAKAPAGKIPSKKGPQTKAEKWAKDHQWPVATNDIGPAFLCKAAKLVRADGRVAMLQPATTLLHSRSGPAMRLRKKLFTEFTVDEITNLSAIRRDIFTEVVGPACVIILGTAKPKQTDRLLYVAPKPHLKSSGHNVLIIEPHDANQITHAEAANDPRIWTVFALGGRRDWNLIQRLSSLPTLEKLSKSGDVICCLGVIAGRGQQELKAFRGRKYFAASELPEGTLMELNVDPIAASDHIYAASTYATDPEAYKQPQMLIKQSYSSLEGRYRAVRVRSTDPEWGVVCQQAFLSVRDTTPDAPYLRVATCVYNSRFASYYLNLTGSRVLFNTNLLGDEVRSLPLPAIPTDWDEPKTFAEIDAATEKAIKLNESESILVADFLDTILPRLLRSRNPGLGYRPTARGGGDDDEEPQLSAYAQMFVQVIKSTFGNDKPVSATIFQEYQSKRLPVRMVGIHLNWPEQPPLAIQRLNSSDIHTQLQRLYDNTILGKGSASMGKGLGFQRVAFLFQSRQTPRGRVRSLYIIKPDERRYWLQGLAMRDADQLSAAILKAGNYNTSLA